LSTEVKNDAMGTHKSKIVKTSHKDSRPTVVGRLTAKAAKVVMAKLQQVTNGIP
jgi:hypothetical protein